MENNSCPFCNISEDRIVATSKGLIAIKDQCPVTKGHTLVIPKIHRETYFDLVKEEVEELFPMLHNLRKTLIKEDPSISGFNIGANCGASAGQTVFHCHIHLIPRRNEDCKNPRGGVRGVIAEKQNYKS